jgi:arginase family enzyme
MNINDYLTPIALEKKDPFFVPDESSFISSIKINTPNSPIDDLEGIQIAIIGVPESRNSYNKGAEKAPDAIRNKLYQLKFTPRSNTKRIFDLGDLKPGNSVTDTYFGLKEILVHLLEKNITVIILGGSQDISVGGIMAFNRLEIPVNLTTIDSRIDYNANVEIPKSINYLTDLIESDKYQIDDFTNIGHQIYLNDEEILEKLYQYHYECIRLGEAKKELIELEPLLRETTFLGFDISSIKQSDAPGHYNPSPNGFLADEACTITRYAGISEKIKVFGLFDVNPEFDNNNQTSHLAAQAIWYFIDGYYNRFDELPEENNANYKKFIIELNNPTGSLTFFKSQKSNRWWMGMNNNDNKQLIACSYKDYQIACNNEIPSRCLKFHTNIK